ncbi:MAG: transporter substrate-binding domain-containing protein [Hahellaceae bacterium]|nr:transporter substrate-binding domain-containing protein [Hahellaceae bacterium]MCP5168158.1 transporter substrate-binding domain-containing protein [Hahellaceae bacterium]
MEDNLPIGASYLRKLSLMIAVSVLTISGSTSPAQAENGISSVPLVTVALNHAPPYRILEKGAASGLYIEIFNALIKELGWQVHYEEVPFRRALKMLEDGQADVMLGPVRKPEREQYIDFSIPAFPPERRLFVVNRPSMRIFKYSDLAGKKIGVLRGSVYFEPFDSDLDLLKETGTDYRNLLAMLSKDYLDVVVVPELLSVALQKEMNLDMTTSEFFVPGETSYIGVSRKSSLMNRLAEIRWALDEIKFDKTYEQLLLKYMARDRVESVSP